MSLPVSQPSTVVKYHLSEQTFSQFFPDEPPLFPSSPPFKGAGRGSPAQVSAAVEVSVLTGVLKLWGVPL